ncbi:unnamed protein product [Brachionus calyciflorus]|uniref:Uncharacterized protein n=1 Tax=Brachionus calyciflorus TaxID=104777 RepID=A0A814LEI1_9BILA|nr:unnamed protein product [Brachionus calyciflorus]
MIPNDQFDYFIHQIKKQMNCSCINIYESDQHETIDDDDDEMNDKPNKKIKSDKFIDIKINDKYMFLPMETAIEISNIIQSCDGSMIDDDNFLWKIPKEFKERIFNSLALKKFKINEILI